MGLLFSCSTEAYLRSAATTEEHILFGSHMHSCLKRIAVRVWLALKWLVTLPRLMNF